MMRFRQLGCGLLLGLGLLGCVRRPGMPSSVPAAPLFPPSLGAFKPPLLPSLAPSRPLTLFHEPFNGIDPAHWREIEASGRTTYTVENLDGLRALKAHATGGASILLATFRFDPKQYPWVSWRWRIDQAVVGEDLAHKPGSDASARIYVYFDTTGLPWQKRSLDYIWSTSQPADTLLTSPYSKNSKMLIVEFGGDRTGRWTTVSRNVRDDYRRCFGEDAPDVVAIGVMTDSDNTKSDVVAYYDDLMVTRLRPSVPPEDPDVPVEPPAQEPPPRP